MDLTSNFFEIFRLPLSYKVDKPLLDERYLILQRQFHPDRYAGRSAQEQRLAVQSSAAINQAYDVLCSPVKRAQYLLEQSLLELRYVDMDVDNGADIGNGEQTIADTEFLMEQMQLREELIEVRSVAEPFAELDILEQKITGNFKALEQEFAAAYTLGELARAGDALVKMQFYSKLQTELEDLEDILENYLEDNLEDNLENSPI
ncbi:MAG: Fe-S protein assembly co-chaperone HscB [Gammaproteobacteria bacterium]|nr:MAG: Fe-S protein assembly co-chaperone HscB [Gammaproteobacteria bacterium]